MRGKRAAQRSVFDTGYPDHTMGRMPERVSRILGGHPEFLLDWIEEELGRGKRKSRRVSMATDNRTPWSPPRGGSPCQMDGLGS